MYNVSCQVVQLSRCSHGLHNDIRLRSHRPYFNLGGVPTIRTQVEVHINILSVRLLPRRFYTCRCEIRLKYFPVCITFMHVCMYVVYKREHWLELHVCTVYTYVWKCMCLSYWSSSFWLSEYSPGIELVHVSSRLEASVRLACREQQNFAHDKIKNSNWPPPLLLLPPPPLLLPLLPPLLLFAYGEKKLTLTSV